MSSTLDDSQLTFAGDWTHAEDGSANLVDGTQSWTNDPAATFSFTFGGTGFDFCAGLKADRGAFSYTIDGASHGSGTQLGDGTEMDPVCQTVASVRNLAAGTHSVVFRNAGSTYFAADAVTIFGDAVSVQTSSSASVVTTTSSVSSSSSSSLSAPVTTTTSSSSSSSSSVQVTSSTFSSSSTLSILSSSSSASASAAAAGAQQEEAHSGVSSGRKAALIGGPILGGIIFAVLAFFIYTRCKRKREADSVAIAPSTSSHYLDEKDEKGGLFYGPTEREREREGRFSPLHFAGRISPLPFSKGRGHNRLNSEMSLESHTEPFQPTSLAQPPYVEPFRLPAGDFDHYRNSACNPTAPAPAHVLQRQSSYDDRLAAASANLPNWRASKAASDASRYPSTVWATEVEADRLSSYSALYEGLLEEDESTESHDPKDRYR